MLRYALDRGLLNSSWAISAAVAGHVRVLRWLYRACRAPFYRKHAAKAAEYGHIQALRWILDHGVNYHVMRNGSEPIEAAAKANELVCLKWLLENGSIKHGTLQKALYAAAENGHVESANLLVGFKSIEMTCHLASIAAANGHLKMLTWLHERNAPWRDYAALLAAENGRLDCLKYAVANGLFRDADQRVCALKRATVSCDDSDDSNFSANKVAVFRYLVDELGAEITDEVVRDYVGRGNSTKLVDFCASRGHLPTCSELTYVVDCNREAMVSCMRRHGVPWSRFVVTRLLKRSAWGALITALQNGAPVSFSARYAATKRDLIEGAKILHEHGSFFGELDSLMLQIAVENNAVKMTKWMVEHGVPNPGRKSLEWKRSATESNSEYMNEAHAIAAARQGPFSLSIL